MTSEWSALNETSMSFLQRAMAHHRKVEAKILSGSKRRQEVQWNASFWMANVIISMWYMYKIVKIKSNIKSKWDHAYKNFLPHRAVPKVDLQSTLFFHRNGDYIMERKKCRFSFLFTLSHRYICSKFGILGLFFLLGEDFLCVTQWTAV